MARTPGLVAAYAFDEGSGSAANDASGNGKDGTISGASWVTGHTGGALSFDGTDDHVALGSLGTFYNSGFTLEAWVRKTTTKKDVAVVGTWAGSGPMLWIDHVAGHHYATLGGSLSSYLDSGQSPLVGQWQHLAATFDGTTARYYIDGAAVASQRGLRRGRQLGHLAHRRLRQPAREASSTARSTTFVSTTARSAPARSCSTATTV